MPHGVHSLWATDQDTIPNESEESIEKERIPLPPEPPVELDSNLQGKFPAHVPSPTSTARAYLHPPYPHQSIQSSEKAWKVARNVQAFHQDLLTNPRSTMNANNFKPLVLEDLVRQLNRLFDTQQELGTPIDIGYHYTHQYCIPNIDTRGLLTKDARKATRLDGQENGSMFGEGIYTANNPFAYHEFGGANVCYFVARVRGKSGTDKNDDTMNTIVGRGDSNDQVVVLRAPGQCAAMARFSSGLANLDDDCCLGNKMIEMYHQGLQNILNECTSIPDTLPPPIPQVLPSDVQKWEVVKSSSPASQVIHQPRSYKDRIQPGSQPCRRGSQPIIFVRYDAPDSLKSCQWQDHVSVVDQAFGSTLCSICMEDLTSQASNPVVEIRGCKHCFHQGCVEQALNANSRCPTCRAHVGGFARGTMPSGHMIVEKDSSLSIPGSNDCDVLVIHYLFEPNRQKSYHPNPGKMHSGTCRIAYLPDTIESEKLLKRLVHAFKHGLSFRVGDSITHGMSDQITWTSIHHKTSLVPNAPYGFPDSGYFVNVNEDLDALGVPSWKEL